MLPSSELKYLRKTFFPNPLISNGYAVTNRHTSLLLESSLFCRGLKETLWFVTNAVEFSLLALVHFCVCIHGDAGQLANLLYYLINEWLTYTTGSLEVAHLWCIISFLSLPLLPCILAEDASGRPASPRRKSSEWKTRFVHLAFHAKPQRISHLWFLVSYHVVFCISCHGCWVWPKWIDTSYKKVMCNITKVLFYYVVLNQRSFELWPLQGLFAKVLWPLIIERMGML